MTEIPSPGFERLTTERIKEPGGQAGQRERDGDNEGAGDKPDYGLRNAEETTPPITGQEHVIKIQENEVEMSEGKVNGEKRNPSECDDRLGNGKWRRREGIKRNLQDIAPVSYEEYDENWDIEDQSKKCKNEINCLLDSCKCSDRSQPIRDEGEARLLQIPTGAAAEGGGQASTRIGTGAKPRQDSSSVSRYSAAAVASNTA